MARKGSKNKVPPELHDMYMFRAGWRRFVESERQARKTQPVTELMQAVDSAVDSLVEAFEENRPAMLVVDVYQQMDLPHLREIMEGELAFRGLDEGDYAAQRGETIDEALRRLARKYGFSTDLGD